MMLRVVFVAIFALSFAGGSAAGSKLDEGMWPPFLIGQKAEDLTRLGLELDPAALQDPTAFPLNAIIKLGNPRHSCSASFLSAEGLVATNHHCVEGFLSGNSGEGKDLNKTGFLAETKADEILAAPTARLYVTTQFRDVTDEVLSSVLNLEDPAERFKAIQAKQRQVQEACNELAPVGHSCEVASFFEGAEFYEIISLEIKDVRLVYAPEKQIGFYGGFDDNWRWPRHTGDFAFLRGYVAKDGTPAEYSAENVPFNPSSYLKVAEEGLSPSDFVMVTGYPGSTSTLKTAEEAREAAEWLYPWLQEHYFGLVDVLRSATPENSEARFAVQPLMFGLTNAAQLYEGSSKNMVDFRLLAEKVQLEVEINRWIREDENRYNLYQNVIEEMAFLYADRRATRNRDRAFSDITRSTFSTELLGVAESVVGFLENKREVSNDQNKIAELERDLNKTLNDFYDSVDFNVDRAKFAFQLKRMASLEERDQPESYKAIAGRARAANKSILEWLYDSSWLLNRDITAYVVTRGSLAQLSNDPMISFAKLVREERKEVQARTAEFNGAMQVLRPLYVAAMRDYTGAVLFPDANSTLRISYGNVMGYSVAEAGVNYTPFSTVSEMMRRHQNEGVFQVPDRLLEAATGRNYGGYVMRESGELPVDFLSNLHITGGNSGSATLNGKGEFVGLAFDSNYEGLGGDWRFIPELTRSIHVDVRYMMWVMDAVDCADHLLVEMGIQPQIDNPNCQ